MLTGIVPATPTYWAGEAGDSAFSPGTRLEPGTLLPGPTLAWYHPSIPPEVPIPFDYRVVYEDGDLIVVDKPHFLPTTSNGRIVRETLQTRLRVDYGEDSIVPLHRLDRLTSGLVLCSRNPRTRAAYQLFSKSVRCLSTTGQRSVFLFRPQSLSVLSVWECGAFLVGARSAWILPARLRSHECALVERLPMSGH